MGRRKGSKNKPVEESPQSHVEIASVKHVEPTDLEKAKALIADLEAKLATADAGRSKAEQKSLEEADSSGTEKRTGKTVKLQRLKNYKEVGYRDNGLPILKPVFELVDVPTYFYKINMAPCGGDKLRINGHEYYHGATYELDVDTLRTIKDIVYRTWNHDENIHGSDENFYRNQQRPQLSARGMR